MWALAFELFLFMYSLPHYMQTNCINMLHEDDQNGFILCVNGSDSSDFNKVIFVQRAL